ncbi:MAG: SUMF1/EgtB/PvdO family nonheme iron enzyme [Bacteroidales bacterium]|nr:SUMF1/EgtB/PvdO family nonheme iron enzyme [Bacteroidales bacterium]
MNRLNLLLAIFFICIYQTIYSQDIALSVKKGVILSSYTLNGKTSKFPVAYPLLTFRLDNEIISLADAKAYCTDSSIVFHYKGKISGEIIADNEFQEVWQCRVILRNPTGDTIDIENLVPFGEIPDHVFLTAQGPWALARAWLFRPAQEPVSVILPDNAWEMGYGALEINDTLGICAIARRAGTKNAESRRYRTIIYPGGSVEYVLWADDFTGKWQNGLKKMFREHYLFDLGTFDETLYQRKDLHWIRRSYLIGLQFAWNREFYDWKEQKYTADSFLEKGQALFGGYDVIGLWPTWPRLGVDRRNQWDMFAGLPGGLEKIRQFSVNWKQKGTKFFICYNPWDESTRTENPYEGMARLIEATDADGVVLDCHGASSYALQHAADSVKAGVIMYSEGMAVVKDMPGIVAGRVHDAIVMSPLLNLNKLIRPDFGIFRVCQLHDGRIRREVSIALFNGYGTELNTFAPGQAANMENDLVYLGKTTQILRENTSCFTSVAWTPLINTTNDGIWVNEWPEEKGKTLFTVLSLRPEGFSGPLFKYETGQGKHAISLWHHEELDWIEKEGEIYIPAKLEAFNSFDIGTRAESSVDCIAILPELLNVKLESGILNIIAQAGDEIRIWAGNPSYQNKACRMFPSGIYRINVTDIFDDFEGKIVVQLFDDHELADERIVMLEPGSPRLVVETKVPASGKSYTGDMIRIPGGAFLFRAENTDQFIPYPETRDAVTREVTSFYIDKYPVTNQKFLEFLKDSGYRPSDTVNFLNHWLDGTIPPGLEDHPVVYVSLEDARAYAEWAGKRLPTEVEWQYAAQDTDGRIWPWGSEFDSTRCNNGSGFTTAVDAFPLGASPFGVMDMTGNVWQLTGDVYDNGTYYFVIMKGGSFYKPTSSWWYVKGGPQPNTWHQQLLLVSPGFDRCATVGFRCVKDSGE